MKLQDVLWFDPSHIFINGAWRKPDGARTIDVENPSTGDVIGVIGHGTADDVDAAVGAAHAALEGPWGKLTATERGRILMKMSALVLERADELAMIEALDVGKPLHQSRNDSIALARYLEF